MPTQGETVRYIHRKDRRQRADETQFAIEPTPLVGTPHVFAALGPSATSTTNLSMPANGRLAISHSVALSAGDVTINIGDRQEFNHPALAIDEIYRGIRAEEDMVVSITRNNANVITGNFSIYLVDAFGQHIEIATCSFTA
jgi:hypothetical protein